MSQVVLPLCRELALEDSLHTVYVASLVTFGAAWAIVLGIWFLLTCAAREVDARARHRPLTRYAGDTEQDEHGGRRKVAAAAAFGAYRAAVASALVLFTLQVALYIALLASQGSNYDATLAPGEPDSARCVPWLRWAVYTFSCGLLARTIAKASGLSVVDLRTFVVFVMITLATGAVSAATTGDETARWVWFAFGGATYVPALLVLATRGESTNMLVFVLVTWSFYPVIFALGPALGASVSLATESWLYLAADGVTKLLFEAYVLRTARLAVTAADAHCSQ
jgi:bacteriorhodopsin